MCRDSKQQKRLRYKIQIILSFWPELSLFFIHFFKPVFLPDAKQQPDLTGFQITLSFCCWRKYLCLIQLHQPPFQVFIPEIVTDVLLWDGKGLKERLVKHNTGLCKLVEENGKFKPDWRIYYLTESGARRGRERQIVKQWEDGQRKWETVTLRVDGY